MAQEVNGQLVPIGGGDPIPLKYERLTIGRRESCDICLRFPDVSHEHAELTFFDGYWYIRDINSTNGIKVQGQRVQKKLLHPNDEISIGRRHKYHIEYILASSRRVEELEEEEDVMGQSLLEKAGLERPKRPREERPRGGGFDPGEFLLQDEDKK